MFLDRARFPTSILEETEFEPGKLPFIVAFLEEVAHPEQTSQRTNIKGKYVTEQPLWDTVGDLVERSACNE